MRQLGGRAFDSINRKVHNATITGIDADDLEPGRRDRSAYRRDGGNIAK
jgi:hypothetical protein